MYKIFLALILEIMIFKCVFPKGFQNSKTIVNTYKKISQDGKYMRSFCNYLVAESRMRWEYA